MRYFRFEKLVRDSIVVHMEENNQKPTGVRTLSDEEFIAELIRKVIEEAKEMKGAMDREELKEEIADVFEVLDYLKEVLNLSNSEMEEIKEDKIEKNGGFSSRTYIEKVGVTEDNKWFQYYLDNPDKYPEVK